MKVGLCVIDMPASWGGGFVFRDVIAKAAMEMKGRHQLDLIKVNPISREYTPPPPAPRADPGDPIAPMGRKALLKLALQCVTAPAAAKAQLRARVGRFIEERVNTRVAEERDSLVHYINWKVDQQLGWPNPDKFRVFDDPTVPDQGYDLFWYNNIEPIHTGAPYIFNIFDLQHRQQPWFPEVSDKGQFRLREGAYAETLQRAVFVVTASEETKQQVTLFYGVPPERIRVIPFPTPQGALEAGQKPLDPNGEQKLRAKYGIKGRFLFYPAQFWAHKNHVNLMRALKVLVDQGEDLSLVFTGADYGNSDYCKRVAAELGLADRVHFLGFVDYEDITGFYRHAVALSYMTFFGPDNLPPLEAFALGCPVVLTNTPGVETLYEDAAVFVNNVDEHAIAAGIRQVLDDPKATAARVAKGRAIAARNTVANYVERVQDLFDEFEAVRRTWAGTAGAAVRAPRKPGAMRVMIISTDYAPFLKSLYDPNPDLRKAPYRDQLRTRNETLFAGSDFYSANFIKQGHEAWEFHVNNGPLQQQWLNEHGQAVGPRPEYSSPLHSPVDPNNIDVEEIILRQVREMQPDVILNQAVSEVPSRVLEKLRPYTKLIVGQIASPYPENEDYRAYDMMISSLPNFVQHFRSMGLEAELNLLGFDPSVLEHVRIASQDVPLSFVGSITSDHGVRYNLIERLARETDIKIWGRLVNVPDDSPIKARYQGEAWGKGMFTALGRSKITINQHIDIAENYANNMRLFEATGMGAMLITDWKSNIADLYEPGREVVVYKDADECIEKINYYLAHEDERAAIAAAGQRRTLRDHTYGQVVAEQVRLFKKALAAKGVAV